MNRQEIIEMFRVENPEITSRVITDAYLQSQCKEGNRRVCSLAKCITDEDGTVISTSENDERFDLTDKIDKFYAIDSYPGSGVLYNNERLKSTTMAELDNDDENWRDRSSGTPEKFYRRGKWLCLDRPVGSEEDDLKVYCVLKPDDFDADTKTPYNELEYLEPFHYAIVLYLKWRAKEKVGKGTEAKGAETEFLSYIAYMKKELGGSKFKPIRFLPRAGTV